MTIIHSKNDTTIRNCYFECVGFIALYNRVHNSRQRERKEGLSPSSFCMVVM